MTTRPQLQLAQPTPPPAPADDADASPYTVRGIPAPLLGAMWHYAEPYLKRALDHANGEFTTDDFKRLCEARDVQLWLVHRGGRVAGAITTEIVVYPHRKHCRVITLAGSDFPGWVSAADTALTEWASAQGCDAIESYVRKGLVPKMASHGYKHRHSVLVKEIPK